MLSLSMLLMSSHQSTGTLPNIVMILAVILGNETADDCRSYIVCSWQSDLACLFTKAEYKKIQRSFCNDKFSFLFRQNRNVLLCVEQTNIWLYCLARQQQNISRHCYLKKNNPSSKSSFRLMLPLSYLDLPIFIIVTRKYCFVENETDTGNFISVHRAHTTLHNHLAGHQDKRKADPYWHWS